MQILNRFRSLNQRYWCIGA